MAVEVVTAISELYICFRSVSFDEQEYREIGWAIF